jgi:hypothetical protein
MTMLTLPAAPAATHRFDLRDLFREPLFAGAGLVLALLALPTAAALVFDGRLLQGVDIWAKPLKFEIALVIYLLTLSAYARWLPSGTVGRTWYRIYAATVVFAIAYEMAVIVGAAALGTASHFNPSPVGEVLYALMGVLAVHLTGASLVYGVLIARSDRAPRDPALRAGVVLGLVLTFGLTVVIAGYIGQHGSHFVGGSGSDAGGLALMGWARDAGDLRVPHFFATHAMHALPLAGFAAGRWLAPRPALAVTWGAAAAYTAFCVATFAQALAGQPFLPGLL